MQQQINLFVLLPKRKQKKLGFETMLYLYGIFFVVLFLHYAHMLTKKNNLLDELQRLNVQLLDEKKNLSAILEKYPLINPDDLAGSLIKLQANLASKERMMQTLTSPAKFSEYLTALAGADIQEQWLTEIIIQEGGLYLELHGLAANHLKVKEYFDNLKRQPFFSNMEFQEIDISHPEEKEGAPIAVGFTIIGKATSLNEK